MSKTRKEVFSSNVQPPKKALREKRVPWRCDDCGKSNDAHFVQCNHCGAYYE